MSAKYFKLIWRSLLRERQFSVLNLIGLSTGLACALLIWLWVNNERSTTEKLPGEEYSTCGYFPSSPSSSSLSRALIS
jgi:hypothetical protein